jgi:hypothetical protein
MWRSLRSETIAILTELWWGAAAAVGDQSAGEHPPMPESLPRASALRPNKGCAPGELPPTPTTPLTSDLYRGCLFRVPRFTIPPCSGATKSDAPVGGGEAHTDNLGRCGGPDRADHHRAVAVHRARDELLPHHVHRGVYM